MLSKLSTISRWKSLSARSSLMRSFLEWTLCSNWLIVGEQLKLEQCKLQQIPYAVVTFEELVCSWYSHFQLERKLDLNNMLLQERTKDLTRWKGAIH